MVKLLVTLSVIFSVAAYFPYIRAILKTRGSSSPVRPNRASWFVWLVIDLTMVVSLSAAGAFSVVPMFAAFSLGSAIVLGLSVKDGEGGFTRFDLVCVGVAFVGLVLWQVSGDPLVSVFANVVAAWAGTIPTIRKSWVNPEGEDLTTWLVFAIGGLFNCLAIRDFTLASAIAPISVFGAQLAISGAIILSSRRTLAV